MKRIIKSQKRKKTTAAADPETAEYKQRLSRFQSELARRRLDAMIVFGRQNTFYLTGFRGSVSYLLVTPREARLLVDGRYIEATRDSVAHCEVVLVKKLPAAFEKWQREISPRRIGIEGDIPWDQWKAFAELLPGVDLAEAGAILRKMRLRKSALEIKKIEASARLNDEVFEAALKVVGPGTTELDLRNAIRAEADRRGAEGESFDCIVATGTAGSMPHYKPADREICEGDLLLIDMGLIVDGYCSDMTRVVAIGEKPPPARLRRAYDAVLEAEEAALAEVGPGVRCADLHNIALDRLKAKRLGRYFTHGLGHGVGIDVHEGPVLNPGSSDVLRPGMIVTVEPGVYLPGVGGIRIEDLAVVTRNGHRVLSRSPKAYRTIPYGS